MKKIPFSNDIRNPHLPFYDFLANEKINNKSMLTSYSLKDRLEDDMIKSTKKHSMDHRVKDLETAVSSIDSLIKSFELKNNEYLPEFTPNPCLHNMNSIIIDKALGYGYSDTKPKIKDILTPKISEQTKSELKRLAECFQFILVEKPNKRTRKLAREDVESVEVEDDFELEIF